MKPTDSVLHRELVARQSDRAVVRVFREELGDEGVLGRIAQFSDDVLILARLDGESRDEGLTALRMSDITRIVSGTRESRAHAALGADPVYEPLPEASILTLPSVIALLSSRYPILALHTEALTPDELYIGAPSETDREHLVLLAWGPAPALDTYQVVLLTEQITRIDAGEAYLEWLVRAHALPLGQAGRA